MANLLRNGVDVCRVSIAIKCSCQSRFRGRVWALFPLLVSEFDLADKTFSLRCAERMEIWKYSSTHRHAPACFRMLTHRLNFGATFSRLSSDRSPVPTNEARMCGRPFFVWILCTNENLIIGKCNKKRIEVEKRIMPSLFEVGPTKKSQKTIEEENVYYPSWSTLDWKWWPYCLSWKSKGVLFVLSDAPSNAVSRCITEGELVVNSIHLFWAPRLLMEY